MSTDRQASAADIKAAQDALAQAEGESVRVPANRDSQAAGAACSASR